MFRLGLLLGLCCLWSATCAADISSVVEHVPANTVLAITSGDVGLTCSDFQRTRLGETLTDADFKGISFVDFLPEKGAKNVTIYNSNIVGFSKLSSWSYISKSPILEIINSTAIHTTGPRF